MNISQRVPAVNKFYNFAIPKTNEKNERCTSTACPVWTELILTHITQSIIDKIYNEAKGIIGNGLVLKEFGDLFYVKDTTDQNIPFRIIISNSGNGSCKGAIYCLKCANIFS